MNKKKTMIAAAIAIALGLAVAASAQAQPFAPPPKVGDEAPDFTLETHDGKSLTFSRLEGHRGAVLVFFATWCEPCMAEVPHVKDFVEATRNKNILVYGVNQDQSLRVVKRFVKDKKINYRVLLDKGNVVAVKYGAYGIPFVVAVDAAGVVRYIGYSIPEGRKRDALVEALTAPLKDKKESDVGSGN